MTTKEKTASELLEAGNSGKSVNAVFLPDGNTYVLLEERYKDFLREFPLAQWSQEFEMIDPMVGLNGETRVKLYLETIKAGFKPSDMGITLIFPESGTIWYRMTLTNRETGAKVQADAVGKASDIKAIERIQTAAKQRVVAACGFSSGTYLNDECEHIERDQEAIVHVDEEIKVEVLDAEVSEPQTAMEFQAPKLSAGNKRLILKWLNAISVDPNTFVMPVDNAQAKYVKALLKEIPNRVSKGEDAIQILQDEGLIK